MTSRLDQGPRGAWSPRLSRITVRGGGRRVDLALPSDAPLAELTPALARLCGLDAREETAPAGDDATPPAWTLAPVGGEPLALSTSLGQAGVVDGDVLYLVDASVWEAPLVVPVEEAVSQALTGPRWGGGASSRLLAAAGSLYLVLAVGVGVWLGAARGAGGLVALLAAAVVLGMAALARAPGQEAARLGLVLGGCALAGAGTWGLLGAGADAVGLLAAGAGVALVALIALPVAPAVTPGVLLAVVAAAAGAGLTVAGVRAQGVAALVLLLAVLGLRLLPAAMAGLLGTATAEDASAVRTAAAAYRRRLSSLSAGLATVALGAVVVIVVPGDPLGLALGTAAALALALQARSYEYLPEVLPLAGAAALALAALEVAAAARLAPLGTATLVLAGLVLTGLGLMSLALAREGRVPGGRTIRSAWLPVDVALVSLGLVEMGVLAAVVNLVHGIAG